MLYVQSSLIELFKFNIGIPKQQIGDDIPVEKYFIILYFMFFFRESTREDNHFLKLKTIRDSTIMCLYICSSVYIKFQNVFRSDVETAKEMEWKCAVVLHPMRNTAKGIRRIRSIPCSTKRMIFGRYQGRTRAPYLKLRLYHNFSINS